MTKELIEAKLLEITGAHVLGDSQTIQRLWSGYGSIVRYELIGASVPSVIVKHVSPPTVTDHPRGWNSDRSHARKLRSYAVETAWYQNYAGSRSAACRLPECYAVEVQGDEVLMVLEDLDAAGFALRRTSVNELELYACLNWLAQFHARFLGQQPNGLWELGTYWHLETRPDELKVLAAEDPALCAAAEQLDTKLNQARYQTLVHGDAKLANFCFAPKGDAVAAVDFQYVGGGCGMKDVAYFIGSCLSEEACEQQESELLDVYFSSLKAAVSECSGSVDTNALEAEWRDLYAIAWTDFHRFLKGWSPGHWKINSYSERLARGVVASLSGGEPC